ncbi:MAG: Fic family protein, partial [Phycisphaerae bacterium]|nr:Fic family protein [Phycisphaerae bacterium]
MTANDLQDSGLRPAGYAALVERFGLQVIPNWHESFVATTAIHRLDTTSEVVRETYSCRYWPGDGLGDHLEFALKYDGTNLAILASIFHAADPGKLAAYVQSKPTGKYARRLWYLYEMLTGQRLQLDDLKRGNYVDLLDPEEYYTARTTPDVLTYDGEVVTYGTAVLQIRRQRINDNLLGDRRFCPTIRRTDTLKRLESTDLRERCQKVVADYPPELLKRALSYLYMKETKSSFEIEHIKPNANRTERFVALLQLAEHEDFCDKLHLIDLQNRIVDPRFADADYRTSQNYVGETVAWQAERVHFVCPRPKDVPDLMAGLIAAHQRMAGDGVHPVVQAAAVAFGFVFLHPFEDGNGRIHRFLIHNILARRGFTPEGIMFPVSAAMLKNPGEYDASLEAFSRPLMPLVDYSLDEEGRMTVHNDTAVWYRYIDMTAQAEVLFAFIEKTIDTELVEELTFLANYDRTKAAIQNIVDMPDRQIDLFIRFCL